MRYNYIEVTVAFRPRAEDWGVYEGDDLISTHSLKQEAESSGRSYAKDVSPSKLVIERKDGNVTYQQVYN